MPPEAECFFYFACTKEATYARLLILGSHTDSKKPPYHTADPKRKVPSRPCLRPALHGKAPLNSNQPSYCVVSRPTCLILIVAVFLM